MRIKYFADNKNWQTAQNLCAVKTRKFSMCPVIKISNENEATK